MHDAAMPMVVIDRVVLGRAVVPKGERSGRPAKATGEFRPHLVAEEKIEERRAFRLAHAFETNRVGGIDIERLAPGLRMRANHRMFCKEVLARLPARARADAVLARARNVGLGRAAYPDEPVEESAPPARQRLVGEIP